MIRKLMGLRRPSARKQAIKNFCVFLQQFVGIENEHASLALLPSEELVVEQQSGIRDKVWGIMVKNEIKFQTKVL